MAEQTHETNEEELDDQAAIDGTPTGVELVFDAETSVLSASLTNADDSVITALSDLTDLVAQEGYADYYFERDALQQLFSRIEQNERGTFPIGERRDARLLVEVSDDAMHAVVSVEKPYGGAPVSAQQLQACLTEANVDAVTWDHQALREVVTEGAVKKHKVASGTEAEHGTDSEFINLVDGVVLHAPTEGELGNVNQYEIKEFVVVEAGAPLMRRRPATPGKDGVNIHGVKLPATPGKHTSFAKDLAHVIRDEEDRNLLIAAEKGHPILLSNGVRLDETLKLPSADMRSGDIEFDGSIFIDGDVSAGVYLNVTGDITVKGAVQNATLQAGANIVIGGGAVNPNQENNDGRSAIRLLAGGNIQVTFVTGADLQADGSIDVKEYIGFCRTSAGSKVSVGQSGGKGRIYGGICHAGECVLAEQFGSSSSAETTISVGHPTNSAETSARSPNVPPIFASKSIHAGITLEIDGASRKFNNREHGGGFNLQDGAITRIE